jgi:hypothetical protein
MKREGENADGGAAPDKLKSRVNEIARMCPLWGRNNHQCWAHGKAREQRPARPSGCCLLETAEAEENTPYARVTGKHRRDHTATRRTSAGTHTIVQPEV